MKASIIIPTHNRQDELQTTLQSVVDQEYPDKEVVVVSDGDADTLELFEEGGPYDEPWIRFHRREERLGIAKALNLAIDEANGDIVITLDDDSYFTSSTDVTTVIEAFEANPDAGLFGFRVMNENSGEEEFPGWKTKGPGLTRKLPFISPIVDLPMGEDVDGPIETTYFPGCGYAVRSEVYRRIIAHPETFVYGAYEDDLAFRIHKTDYSIKYLPSVTVMHKRSPEGTLPDKERISLSYTNNVAVALRHLPWRYVLLNVVLWGGRTLLRTRGDVVATLGALKALFDQRETHLGMRDVVSRDTIRYIKSHGGRLY